MTPMCSRRAHIRRSMSSPSEAGRSSWRPFEEARRIARALGIESHEEYMVWARSAERPKDVPMLPEVVYEDKGWESWDDWLGRSPPIPKMPNRNWRDFEEVRDFTRRLGLESEEEWNDWCRNSLERPDDVPGYPQAVYKDSWQGWDDWLGTELPEHEPPYRDYLHAREFARNLGFESKSAWSKWAMDSPERPLDVPFMPHIIYEGEGWAGWDDFLGSCPVVDVAHGTYLSYDRAQLFATDRGLTTEDQWNEWAANAELPKGIPKSPNKDVYEGAGWGDCGWETFVGSSDDELYPSE